MMLGRTTKEIAMRKAILLLVCVAVIFAAAIGLSGQGGEDCTMTLYVRDDMGHPVSNATAMVYVASVNRINAGSRSSDWAHYTALTDTNGMAVVQFKCFIDGAYEWGVKAAGYYSMMEGPAWISGGIHFKDLIFNPRPGDTNLEVDPRKNYAMSWIEEWGD